MLESEFEDAVITAAQLGGWRVHAERPARTAHGGWRTAVKGDTGWPDLALAHPDARYFGVGRIGADQVRDYAARKGMAVDEVERWLAPNLAYDPDADAAAQ